ncbi:MAG: hypothetical protein HKN45_01870 [Flavobacteriales bacterium]|nr:hypothetical protein [Flavobacteriales bacterium]
MRKAILLIFSTFCCLLAFTQNNEGIEISDHPMKVEWKQEELDSFPYPEAITDCENDNIQWIYIDKKFSGGKEGIIERTWMAEDDCGNKASTIQFILLMD